MPNTEATRPRGKQRVWIAVIAALAVAGTIVVVQLVVGGGKESYTLRGTSLLMDEFGDVEGTWDDCQGLGGYDDFGAGQNVSVVDGEGNLIGTGKTESLSNDTLALLVQMDRDAGMLGLESTTDSAAESEARNLLKEMADLGFACMVYFEVEVPESKFYTIEVGSRGELDYSFDEMKAQNFTVGFTLGS